MPDIQTIGLAVAAVGGFAGFWKFWETKYWRRMSEIERMRLEDRRLAEIRIAKLEAEVIALRQHIDTIEQRHDQELERVHLQKHDAQNESQRLAFQNLSLQYERNDLLKELSRPPIPIAMPLDHVPGTK